MRQRRFTLADQLAFAEISGDNNPIHVDPVVSRRSLFGQPIVHGIHLLMWVLDCCLENSPEPLRIQSLKIVFSKPVGLGQEVRFTRPARLDNRLRIDLLKQDEIVIRMLLVLEPAAQGAPAIVTDGVPAQQPPDVWRRETIEAASGEVDLYRSRKLAAHLFPHLARSLCRVQTAILLASSLVVGVKCPGLHSIYSELNLAAQPVANLRKLNYSVSDLTTAMAWFCWR